MSEIPEDILDKAADVHRAIKFSRDAEHLTEIIAAALAAERERCAQIAEDKHWSVGGYMQVDTQPIADAIRKNPTDG